MVGGTGIARTGVSIVLLLGSVAALSGVAKEAEAIPPCGWYVGRCIEQSDDTDCRVKLDRNLVSVSCAVQGKRYTVYAGNRYDPGKNWAECRVDLPNRLGSDNVARPFGCTSPLLATIAVVHAPLPAVTIAPIGDVAV